MRHRLKLIGLTTVTLVMALAASTLPTSPTLLPVFAQTVQSRKAEADRLLKEGDAQLNAGKTEAALPLLEQALKIYQELRDRVGEGQALKSVGNVYLTLQQYEKALALFQQSLAIAREIKNQDLEARSLLNIGVVYAGLKKTAEAIELYQQSLAVSRSSQNKSVEGFTLVHLADAYVSLNENQKAIEVGQQALVIGRGIKDSLIEMASLNVLTRAYSSLINPQKTLEFGQQSLTLARQLKNQLFEGRALASLADAYASLSENQKAIEAGQQALLIGRGIKDSYIEMFSLYTLARVYSPLSNRQKSDVQKTVEFAQQALPLARQLKNQLFEGRALALLADAYVTQGNNEKAIETAQQGLVVVWKIQKPLAALISLSLKRAIEADGPQKVIKRAQEELSVSQQKQDPDARFSILITLGIAYDSLKDYQKVIEVSQEQLVVARENQNKYLEVLALSSLAGAYGSLENHHKVIEITKQQIIAAQQIKNRQVETSALTALANAYNALGEYRQALESAQQLLVFAREEKNWIDELSALTLISTYYQSLKEYQNAIQFSQQAWLLAQKNKAPLFGLSALGILVSAYDASFDYPKVIEFGNQALSFLRESKNYETERGILQFLANLTGTNLSQEDYENYQKWLESLILSAVGYAYHSQGEEQKAVELSQQGLAIAQQLNNPELKISALLVLGSAFNSLASSTTDYQKAIELVQQALLLTRQIKNLDNESSALSELSDIFHSLNEYQKAIEFGQQSLKVAEESKDPSNIAQALFNLYSVYLDVGDYQNADQVAQKALSLLPLYRQGDSPVIQGLNLVVLSMNNFIKGDYPHLLESANQGIVVSEKMGDFYLARRIKLLNYLFLSIGYTNLGKTKQAREGAQKSLVALKDLSNKTQNVTYLPWIGGIYRKTGQKGLAILTYRETLATSSAIKNADVSGEIMALLGLARTYRELDMTVASITYYKQAVNKVEQVRQKNRRLDRKLQETFLQSFQDIDRTRTADIYRELADLLLSQGKILEAQQVLELLKVQEIQNFTRSGQTDTQPAELLLTRKQEQIRDKSNSLIAFGLKVDECQQEGCPQLDQLLNQRDALTQQFDQQVQEIEKEYRDREVKDRSTLAPQDFLPQAQQIVEAQPGTVLVYPLVLENKTWILWASKGVVVKSIELPNIGQRQLGETVLKFRQLLQNPYSKPEEVKAVGKQLYDWLLKPIEPELKANQIQHLVFSLDRATRYIPMSALFDGEKYLIERYTVATVLSAGYTDMEAQFSPNTKTTKVLALGLSDAKAGFNALPNVPAELDAIVQQNNSDNQGIYPGLKLLNNSFDFPALRRYLGNYQIIHIATHGKFEPTNPDKSFLVLGDGNPLEIPRIRTLQNLRNVYLVVLSACETALGGADQDGVEIAGISSYFLQKGKAKAVMASLWNVNDASTALIMQQFYTHLASGKTKAEALQQVQQDFIQHKLTNKSTPSSRAGARPLVSGQSASGDFSHPYYWAPFILIGNSL